MILKEGEWSERRRGIESLFQASYGRPIQAGYLDWRYIQNVPHQLLFSVEMNGAETVASYSAFPVELVCDGHRMKTMTSMTTMTHPQWQGRGLFPKLAGELYQQAESLKIAGVWGFPNANSHPIFNKKLGWSDIYEIPTLRLDLAHADLDRLPNPGPVVERDDDFSLGYPASPCDGLIRIDRSQAYLVWRYARHPVNRYQNLVLARDGKVSSFLVTKIFQDGMDLVDIGCSDPSDGMRLLTHAVQQAAAQGLKRLSCWCPPHHSMHSVLERLGFVNGEPVTYFGGKELMTGVMPDFWLDYRRWYVQMGDSDVY